MVGQTRGLKVSAHIALVALTYAGLVSCGGGGAGNQTTIMPVLPAQAAADLVVVSPSVSDSSVETDGEFMLSATVRNGGDRASAATTLRFYRSTDAAITTTDTEVGIGPVGALSPSDSSPQPILLTAPSAAGTYYYYGACVDGVEGESDTANNCSASVQVDVSEPQQPQQPQQPEQGNPVSSQPRPDLAVVAVFLASGVYAGDPGRSLTLQSRIRNVGDAVSPATKLRFYSSRNRTITTNDTPVGIPVEIGRIAASRRISSETLTLTAPSPPGTYYYGVCVDAVAEESDTNNNCSEAMTITVDGPPPDLVVLAPDVGEILGVCRIQAASNPYAGKSQPIGETRTRYSRKFRVNRAKGDVCCPHLTAKRDQSDRLLEDGTVWLLATVHNQGAGGAAATTVRYYRSTDATITTSDAQVGTDEVGTLFPSQNYGATIRLTAPSAPGTYYYGACVDAVAEESDTTNNCSSSSARLDVN